MAGTGLFRKKRQRYQTTPDQALLPGALATIGRAERNTGLLRIFPPIGKKRRKPVMTFRKPQKTGPETEPGNRRTNQEPAKSNVSYRLSANAARIA